VVHPVGFTVALGCQCFYGHHHLACQNHRVLECQESCEIALCQGMCIVACTQGVTVGQKEYCSKNLQLCEPGAPVQRESVAQCKLPAQAPLSPTSEDLPGGRRSSLLLSLSQRQAVPHQQRATC
jgi:hypothetical protein